MSPESEKLQDQLFGYLADLARSKPKDALTIATGVFVSIFCSVLESAGQDSDKQIDINGGDRRDITIHAVKERS